jgi:nitroreductase
MSCPPGPARPTCALVLAGPRWSSLVLAGPRWSSLVLLVLLACSPATTCRLQVKTLPVGSAFPSGSEVGGRGVGCRFGLVELAEALRRRRMVRSFSGRFVSDEDLKYVLAAARQAPAAGNTDGWDVVVLIGAEQTSSFWEATTTDLWRKRSRRWRGLSRAPAVICVFTSATAYLERYEEPDKKDSGLGTSARASAPRSGSGREGEAESRWPVPFWFFDAGAAVLAILLAATDAGLGACFLGNFRGEPALCAALGVPSGHRYVGAVLVGEPGGEDPRSASVTRPRRETSEAVHLGHW